jgi:hypothetical protein
MAEQAAIRDLLGLDRNRAVHLGPVWPPDKKCS